MSVKIHADGRFAHTMTSAMREKNIEIKDLADSVNMSYEHIRKLVSGLAYPSRWLLKELCRVLDLDYDKTNQLVVADRIENKYGGIPHQMVGQHPELSLMAPLWDSLTKDQKDMIRSSVKNFATENLRMQRAS